MPSDFRSIDLATINAAQGVIVAAIRNQCCHSEPVLPFGTSAAIRNQCCQWEQESSDAVADGRLSNAVMVQHWAFAADILASKVSSEFSTLFIRSLNARWGDLTTTPHRSVADQILDAVALEVASAQEAPELAPF